jgi:hypothetical protein
MEVLKDDSSPGVASRTQARVPGVLALLTLAGCVLASAMQPKERPFSFNHRFHVEEKELECALCHSSWEDEENPGMPRPAVCQLCHAELDSEKPEDRRVATLFEGDEFKAAGASRQSEEILFSHKSHATRGLECTACHADVERDDGSLVSSPGSRVMSMEACVACHESSTGPAQSDCAACHAVIRAGVSPPSHQANWKRYHGSLVRGHSQERTDQCSLCHRPSECVNCHHIELPESHNNYWRRRAHGLNASMDRASCFTCHDEDSCQRCHEEIRPVSHTGSWGEPTDRHCLSCHEPLRSTSCGVCHAGTPSHETATPLPPDHNPAMNCRLCHGNGQPLPHVDNGQACTTCHH